MKKILFLFAFSLSTTLHAQGIGNSVGDTLNGVTSARASSLGEAFTPISNDIAGMGYNPASLGTLQSGQASFLYEQGLDEESFGQFLIGAPTERGSLGLSLGYYDGGDFRLFDGTTERTVKAQSDLSLGLGYANTYGQLNYGVNAKFLSSEIIGQHRANAFAADIGVQVPVTSRVRVGAAYQNFGTSLQYLDREEDLSTIARVGVAVTVPYRTVNTTLLFDAPYYTNEKELSPALGVELGFGVLSIRGGFRKQFGAQEFTLGTGFLINRSSLDYSFGLRDQEDAQHRVSISLRFGHERVNAPFVQRKKDKKKAVPRLVYQLEPKRKMRVKKPVPPKPTPKVVKEIPKKKPEQKAAVVKPAKPKEEAKPAVVPKKPAAKPETVKKPVKKSPKKTVVKKKTNSKAKARSLAAKKRMNQKKLASKNYKKAKKRIRAKLKKLDKKIAKKKSATKKKTVKKAPKKKPKVVKKKPAKKDGPHVYVIKPKDSLGRIARQYYGQGSLWRVIYKANKTVLKSPIKLPKGAKIVIPALDSVEN